METHERIQAAEDELLSVKQDAEATEVAASDDRVAQRGWPIEVEGEGEVLVVDKVITDATRFEFEMVSEDGGRFVPVERDSRVFRRVKPAPKRQSKSGE